MKQLLLITIVSTSAMASDKQIKQDLGLYKQSANSICVDYPTHSSIST
ncbi:hypothetical protein IS519_20465 [Vibrio crassostreae]|nr:hypothetical protein [Vibrio crassostreae]UPR32898.1 hypothetical protein IS519_20465 [Vibrio crassostreae]